MLLNPVGDWPWRKQSLKAWKKRPKNQRLNFFFNNLFQFDFRDHCCTLLSPRWPSSTQNSAFSEFAAVSCTCAWALCIANFPVPCHATATCLLPKNVVPVITFQRTLRATRSKCCAAVCSPTTTTVAVRSSPSCRASHSGSVWRSSDERWVIYQWIQRRRHTQRR